MLFIIVVFSGMGALADPALRGVMAQLVAMPEQGALQGNYGLAN